MPAWHNPWLYSFLGSFGINPVFFGPEDDQGEQSHADKQQPDQRKGIPPTVRDKYLAIHMDHIEIDLPRRHGPTAETDLCQYHWQVELLKDADQSHDQL